MSKQTERAIEERAEAKRYQRVNDWKALVAEVVPLLQRGIEELPGISKAALKLISETETRRPKNPNVPWGKELDRLHSLLSKAREFCNLTAARLREHLDKFSFCEPEHLQGWVLSELARGYIEKARGLLFEVKALRDLPEEISRVESEIAGKEEYWDEREARGAGFTPARAGVMGKRPEAAEGKQFDQFDPRES